MQDKKQFEYKKAFESFKRLFATRSFASKLETYSKYISVASGSLNKIIPHKSLRITSAVSGGACEVFEFIGQQNLFSKHDNMIALNEFIADIFSSIASNLEKTFIKSSNNGAYYEYKLINKKIIVASNVYRGEIADCFCNIEDVQDIVKELSEIIWTLYSNRIIIKNNKSFTERGDVSLQIVKDDSFEYNLYSQEFHDSYNYIKNFMDVGKHRSIMFYGNPGVGKSTIIEQICSKFSLKTCRINIDSLLSSEMQSIVEFIKIVNPECLIIDDFDKIKINGSMIPLFEKLHKRIKLIMVSVNDIKYFDKHPALMRPGRFDKFIKVDRLDKDIAVKILGESNMQVYELIKEWPAAFINELRENIDAMGVAGTENYIVELQERIDEKNITIKEEDPNEEDSICSDGL